MTITPLTQEEIEAMSVEELLGAATSLVERLGAAIDRKNAADDGPVPA